MRTYNRLLKLLRRSKDYTDFESRAMAQCSWYLDGLQSWTKADLRLFYENHTQTKVEPVFLGGW